MTPHRTGRMVFLIMTALLLLACCVLFAYWQSLASAPVNSVRWLAGRYGVSPNRVRSLAYDLGVDPSQLNQYGPGDFPVNYFRERLKQTEEHQGQVTRAEVEDIVLGSELMCELDPDTLVYLFYSTVVFWNHKTNPAVDWGSCLENMKSKTDLASLQFCIIS